MHVSAVLARGEADFSETELHTVCLGSVFYYCFQERLAKSGVKKKKKR